MHAQDSHFTQPARLSAASSMASQQPQSHDDLHSLLLAGQPLASSSHELPPRYDSHQFPPTPPAIPTHDASDSYFDPNPHTPPTPRLSTDPAAPSSPAPPRAFGSRFPRWGTWLEKRALERHYADIDQQLSPHNQPQRNSDDAPNRRKKSWGAWVEGPDAINDENSSHAASQAQASAGTTPAPPIHLHHFGSRFIPHLPAQPLCSILISLPTPAPHSSTQPSTRQVLLVGTHLGLFAVELHPDQTATAHTNAHQSQPWNDRIRCTHIWSGLGVYQMCVLASDDAGAYSRNANARPLTPASGVLLALTCPSSAKDGFLSSSLMQLSAHAGSVLESVAAAGVAPSSSSSSSQSAHGLAGAEETIAAANFGPAAGGGSGRAVPPAGTGVVRMWHLQAIRQLLVYALDTPDANSPIDLDTPPESVALKRDGLGTILKKTFSRQKVRSTAKSGAHNRSGSSASLADTFDPMPLPNVYARGVRDTMPSSSSPRPSLDEPQYQSSTRRHGSPGSHQHGRPQLARDESLRDEGPHAAALALAMGSVPIQQPSHTASVPTSSNASSSSFADSAFSAGRQAGHKAKEREAASHGALFFSVHEASADTKGAGTWYLAITYARSVMVYEATLPRTGTSRAWSFVKELYAPFPIKAVAFAPAAVSDDPLPPTTPGALLPSKGPTKLRVASPHGPLLTSKKGPQRELSYSSGAAPGAIGVGPARVPRGSAAPASWRKADLCLLLSFGRRAALIRLRDSEVRDFDLTPLPQLTAVADSSDGLPAPQLSLQSPRPVSQVNADNTRLLHVPGEGATRADGQAPSTMGHTRQGSVEQRIREAILDKRSNKHNWIGFSTIEARVLVRQEASTEDPAPVGPYHQESASRLSPTGVSLRKPTSSTSSLGHTDVNKALPLAPVNQNASFEKRLSRMHLSDQNAQYHAAIQSADSSGSGSDSSSDDYSQAKGIKYQLTDPGPIQRRSRRAQQPKRSQSGPKAELVSAKLAIASKANFTHVLALPLPAESGAPLAVMQWSTTPNAVSGWARVLGVERACSTGATSVNHLKPAVSEWSSPERSAGSQGLHGGRRDEQLVLHVGVTCIAFLASRIESRKVSFKLPVPVGFRVSARAELELEPVCSDAYARAHVETENSHETGSLDDGSGVLGASYPAAGTSVRAGCLSQELEYLCGPLLTLPPVDLDARSCGAHEAAPAAPHALVPNETGDATVVAFDWRGADDFRIFTLGIAG